MARNFPTAFYIDIVITWVVISVPLYQRGVKPMKCECCEDQAAQPCQREATHSLTVTVKTGYDGSGDGGDYCETHAGELAAILRDQGFEVTVRELGKHRRAGAV